MGSFNRQAVQTTMEQRAGEQRSQVTTNWWEVPSNQRNIVTVGSKVDLIAKFPRSESFVKKVVQDSRLVRTAKSTRSQRRPDRKVDVIAKSTWSQGRPVDLIAYST